MSISFRGSANIKYTSPKEFDSMVNKSNMQEVGVYPKYRLRDSVTSAKPMFSKYANTCSIVSVNDTMLHLAPELRCYKFIDRFTDLVKKQKDEKGDVTAFVLGGRVNDKESFELFNDIGNVLEKEGADFSMICGKFDPKNKPAMDLDALCQNKDTFTFTQENNRELENFVKENKSLTSDGFKKVFEKFYNFVEISPKHK